MVKRKAAEVFVNETKSSIDSAHGTPSLATLLSVTEALAADPLGAEKPLLPINVSIDKAGGLDVHRLVHCALTTVGNNGGPHLLPSRCCGDPPMTATYHTQQLPSLWLTSWAPGEPTTQLSGTRACLKRCMYIDHAPPPQVGGAPDKGSHGAATAAESPSTPHRAGVVVA